MKRTHIFLACGAGWLALAGFAGYEAVTASHQRRDLVAQRKKSAELHAEALRLKREAATTAQDLAQAERQLAELAAASATETGPAASRQAELAGWLARVKQLRRRFEEKPDQQIPEMRLLDDQDWLRVARSADLDSEVGMRKALAAIRDAAISHYVNRLETALRAFAKSATPQTAPDILALSSYLKDATDALWLSRYEMTTGAQNGNRGKMEWRVQNKTAVDLDYDIHYLIHVGEGGTGYGTSSGSGPISWIPNFQDRARQAGKAFETANPGKTATSLLEVLAFITPPLTQPEMDSVKKQYEQAPR